MRDEFTRRGLLATAGALALARPSFAADAQPVFDDSKPTKDVVIPDSKVAEMNAAPLIPKKLTKLYSVQPTIKEPNAMQFTPAGTLLILDQSDPNRVFEIAPADGKVIRMVQTEAMHGSGICIDAGGNWLVTSTKGLQSGGPPVTLLLDPKTGATLKKWVTPGWGYYGAVREDTGKPSGGHDVKWAGNGHYWMAVPASGRIFLMDEASGKPVRSIPAPVLRTHGLVIDGEYLWSVASDYQQIQKISQKDGTIVGKIQLAKTDPAIHGLEMRNGVLWYCDADRNSGWICTLT
jgi:sugar lactone lactonase YvrE